MEIIPLRHLSRSKRETIRIRAVSRVKAGEHPERAATIFKVHRSSIYNWVHRYEEGAVEGLKRRPITGRPPKLTKEQQKLIFDTVTKKNPVRFGFDSGGWTYGMVREHINHRFGVTLSHVQVGRLLKKLGLSWQKRPLERILELGRPEVGAWLHDQYPRIAKAARKENVAIYFMEEGRMHIPRELFEGLELKKRLSRKFHFFTAVTTRGSAKFMVINGKPSPARFVKFLQRLIIGAAQPIWLIVDGREYQWSQRAHIYVRSTKGRLRVILLPLTVYSPLERSHRT